MLQSHLLINGYFQSDLNGKGRTDFGVFVRFIYFIPTIKQNIKCCVINYIRLQEVVSDLWH
jgi:hypothetical protein